MLRKAFQIRMASGWLAVMVISEALYAAALMAATCWPWTAMPNGSTPSRNSSSNSRRLLRISRTSSCLPIGRFPPSGAPLLSLPEAAPPRKRCHPSLCRAGARPSAHATATIWLARVWAPLSLSGPHRPARYRRLSASQPADPSAPQQCRWLPSSPLRTPARARSQRPLPCRASLTSSKEMNSHLKPQLPVNPSHVTQWEATRGRRAAHHIERSVCNQSQAAPCAGENPEQRDIVFSSAFAHPLCDHHLPRLPSGAPQPLSQAQ